MSSMKAKEVLKLLRITRPTLCRYIKEGKIKGNLLPNGYYDYEEESIYNLLNKEVPRKDVIYARVSTKKQKPDLENQVETLKAFCLAQGVSIAHIYKDIASGMTFERKEFQQLLQEVLEHQIKRIYITYPDRLSRISFKMFKELFANFNVQIITTCETENSKLLEKEVFQEIISLLHCFAMKMYSQRRKQRLTLAKKQLELEEEDVDQGS